MKTLSKNQKIVAMALTPNWQSAQEIKTQATKDGACNPTTCDPIQRIRWKKLVKLKIAAQHPDQGIRAFKRGDNWNDFNKHHGDETTREGVKSLEFEEEMKELLKDLIPEGIASADHRLGQIMARKAPKKST